MIVIHYPSIGSVNPYLEGMAIGLHVNKIEMRLLSKGLVELFVYCWNSQATILHLHWVHGPVIGSGNIKTFVRLMLFYVSLFVWLLRGKKIVWTVHNLVNHERHRALLDRFNSIIVGRLATRVLVHGRASVSTISNLFKIPVSKMRIIFHGNYAHVLQATPLDLDHQEKRFLFFGVIRPYKGVLNLVHSFRSLSGDARLHISGQVLDSRLQRKLEEQVAMDDRVTIDPKLISNDELKRLLAWSDVVVLPFRDILTSGSLLMALTAGRPVVIPRIGLVSEYANEDCAFFYEANDQRGLQIALQSALDCDDLEKMAKAALSKSKNYDWNDVAAKLASVYRELLPMKKK